jgi:hypothetical protein
MIRANVSCLMVIFLLPDVFYRKVIYVDEH